ncbi:MAG: hypothetical protein ACFFCS_22625 [Candidatus Hodarchaeota archaeon]
MFQSGGILLIVAFILYGGIWIARYSFAEFGVPEVISLVVNTFVHHCGHLILITGFVLILFASLRTKRELDVIGAAIIVAWLAFDLTYEIIDILGFETGIIESIVFILSFATINTYILFLVWEKTEGDSKNIVFLITALVIFCVKILVIYPLYAIYPSIFSENIVDILNITSHIVFRSDLLFLGMYFIKTSAV